MRKSVNAEAIVKELREIARRLFDLSAACRNLDTVTIQQGRSIDALSTLVWDLATNIYGDL